MGILIRLIIFCLVLFLPLQGWTACTYTAGKASCYLNIVTLPGDTCSNVGSTGCGVGDTIYVPYTQADQRDVYLRYQVNIPKGATISSSYLYLTAKVTSTNYTYVENIDLVEEDSCAAFTSTDTVTSRTTSNSPDPVTWTATEWQANTQYQTSDIKTLVQAWLDREGHAYNNSYIGFYLSRNDASGAHNAYSGTSNASTVGPIIEINFTGGDPVLSDVYMADPEVRSKQYLYIQLYNTTDTQKLKVTLDGNPVLTKTSGLAGQDTSGEEKVLADYTGLTAGEHTLRAVITDANDVEYDSTVWTRTWTTLHDGKGYVSINEDNSLEVNGVPVLPVTDYLMAPSQWSNFPDSGDSWKDWFNTSLAFGTNGTYSLSIAQAFLTASGGTSYRIGPGWFSGFASTDPRTSMINFSFNETFEGAGTILGACGETGFCWSSSGTVDFDYDAAPLDGSQSMQVTGDGYGELLLNSIYGKINIKLIVKATTRSGATDLITFVDDTDEIVGKVKIDASNHIEIDHCSGGTCTGAQLATGTYNFADNTTHYLWVEWDTDQIGAGYQQGGLIVYAAATDSKPSSPDVIIPPGSSGQGAGDGRVNRIRFTASAGNVIVFDDIADDINDLTEFVSGMKDPATYPKLLGWFFDDEPDMGGTANWNTAYIDWKDYIHTRDTNHPVFVTAYGANYANASKISSPTSYARGKAYGLYMTNIQTYGIHRCFTDVFLTDNYFFHYAPTTSWYPDFEDFAASVDHVVNDQYNLISVGYVLEPDDLSDNMCTSSSTIYKYPCASNNLTMNVPVGSVSGTFTPSTNADPKYVRFAGDNSKVAELLDVRLNEGTAADNAKLKTMYPYPHPSYNSHIVIHELNSSFDSDTLQNNDDIIECTAITGSYGSITCTETGVATAKVITGDTSKTPYLGGSVYKRRPSGSGYRAWTPMPTPEGYINSAWISIIHGARLISNFPRHTEQNYLLKSSLATLLTDMTALAPAILGPVASAKFTVSDENKGGWASASVAGTGRVDYTVRTYNGIDYVFAARIKKHTGDTEGDETATIPVIGLSADLSVPVYGESRAVTSVDGAIVDTFNDHAVHIYAINSTDIFYDITVTNAGDGSGSVTSSPQGINCGATCTAAFLENAEVTLTATPTGDNTFTGWSGTGGCTGTDTCVLTMTEAKAATATFAQPETPPDQYALTVSYAGTGTGVTDPVPGQYSHESGEADVTVTQTPGDNSIFTGWSGTCGCTGTGSCVFVMPANDCTVIATWTADTAYTLTVQYPQNGEQVTSDIGGIVCGYNPVTDICSANYYSDTVTLTTYCASGWYGATYSGDCSGSTCALDMTADKSVSVACSNGRVANVGGSGTITLGGGGTITIGE